MHSAQIPHYFLLILLIIAFFSQARAVDELREKTDQMAQEQEEKDVSI